jgi:hypothetical protein
LVQKGIEAKGAPDTFTVAGTIWVECGNWDSGTKHFDTALRLEPKGTDWSFTKRWGPQHYRQGHLPKILSLVEPNVEAADIDPTLLAFYAFVKHGSGDLEKTKTYFEKTIKIGLTQKSLGRVLRDLDLTAEFIAQLAPLGAID